MEDDRDAGVDDDIRYRHDAEVGGYDGEELILPLASEAIRLCRSARRSRSLNTPRVVVHLSGRAEFWPARGAFGARRMAKRIIITMEFWNDGHLAKVEYDTACLDRVSSSTGIYPDDLGTIQRVLSAAEQTYISPQDAIGASSPPVDDSEDDEGMAMVYFIRAAEINMMKIGYSSNPSRRLQNIQTWSPYDLELIGTMEQQR